MRLYTGAAVEEDAAVELPITLVADPCMVGAVALELEILPAAHKLVEFRYLGVPVAQTQAQPQVMEVLAWLQLAAALQQARAHLAQALAANFASGG
jgi:hypothetical protein